MRAESPSSVISPRVVVGLMIVLFGLALTLDNLGFIESGDLIQYWPFGVIAVGVAKLLDDRARSSRVAGVLLILIGSLVAADHFLYVRVEVWRWWPLAIVFFGLLILSRAFRSDHGSRHEPGQGPGVPGQATGSGILGGRSGSTSTEQTFSEFAMWSGIQRRVASPSFRRADLTAIMGGIEIDLRQAGTDGGEAMIDVFVLWGGIEITVPPDWAVSNNVTPILGGAEDNSTGTQQARHRLIVKGVVIMGGIDIKT